VDPKAFRALQSVLHGKITEQGAWEVEAAAWADELAQARLHSSTPVTCRGEAHLGESAMLSDTLNELLKLPPDERIELALALWESLDDAARDTELALRPEQQAELNRRLAEHLDDPGSAVPWEFVRLRLKGGD
jgi:putative addiction module component (TIGR02574 family)